MYKFDFECEKMTIELFKGSNGVNYVGNSHMVHIRLVFQ